MLAGVPSWCDSSRNQLLHNVLTPTLIRETIGSKISSALEFGLHVNSIG